MHVRLYVPQPDDDNACACHNRPQRLTQAVPVTLASPPRARLVHLQAKADLDTVRYQVCRLMRMLVQVCQTLDKVPAEVGGHAYLHARREPPHGRCRARAHYCAQPERARGPPCDVLHGAAATASTPHGVHITCTSTGQSVCGVHAADSNSHVLLGAALSPKACCLSGSCACAGTGNRTAAAQQTARPAGCGAHLTPAAHSIPCCMRSTPLPPVEPAIPCSTTCS